MNTRFFSLLLAIGILLAVSAVGSGAFPRSRFDQGGLPPSDPVESTDDAVSIPDESVPMAPSPFETSANDSAGLPSPALSDLVTPGTYFSTPSTPQEIDEDLRYMIASGTSKLVLSFADLSTEEMQTLLDEIADGLGSYCEQSYNKVSATVGTTSHTAELTFSCRGHESETEDLRQAALDGAIAIRDQLWAAGIIQESMPQIEKARIYFDWLCQSCAYDETAAADSLSHLPAAVFQNHLAVCNGYTGAYNLLLKLEGIDCRSLSNGKHAWTVATLDGATVHIDPTWGDAGDHSNYQYFAMTEQDSYACHPW